MRYKFVSVSKVKNTNILALELDYLKRMKACGITELSTASLKNCKSAQAEGQLLLKSVSKCNRIVALDERGKQLNSKDLSRLLNTWKIAGASSCAFLIGGAYGLSDEVLSKSDFVWSLSALTFPFALARLLSIEQLYRANCILAGHPYHKS